MLEESSHNWQEREHCLEEQAKGNALSAHLPTVYAAGKLSEVGHKEAAGGTLFRP